LPAPSYSGSAAHYSRRTPISDNEEDDVARAVRAVRTAYDDLQALRTSRHLSIPSSLSDADKVLDEICGQLDVLADSTEALSIFRAYTLKEVGHPIETSLSDAIVHDMEATATYFKAMKPINLTEIQGDWDEQKCQKIKAIIGRYRTIVSMVLNKHKEYVQDRSTKCTYPVDPL
jgi:hypothetical protein